MLLSTDGDFSAAMGTCLTDDDSGGLLFDTVNPEPGDGFWYLVRESEPDATYDSCTGSQVGLRDDEITASGMDCP